MKKILLVEDEKLLGEMYRDKFIQAGFEVIWVDSAEKGIEIVSQMKLDMIILDILLPRKNGIDFLKQLRENKNIAPIPVMAFSNFDDPETKKQVMGLGAKEYLIKTNYIPAEIIEKIKKYLE